MKKALLLFCALFSVNGWASGGYIAQSVEITAVANTAANGMSFTVKTANGNGLCNGESITFPLSVAGNAGNNEEIHSRAYAAALTALTTGKKVSIYSYEDSSVCNRAAFIEIFQ
ncbi:DUF5992 family protein [Microbulbifer sp. TRSA001]|uniref:DUF5992 family protein n=1 Tax=Microbulbifer sp. TRSA001 TaxID=3243381 RepID=UPI004039E3D2